ncbi:MAG: hypothetical protein U0768_01075 [Anaerolineae bacterium]
MKMGNLRAAFVGLTMAVLVMALAGGVAAAHAAPPGTPPLTEAADDAAPHRAPVPRTPIVTITLRDNNGTLRLHRGDTIVLALDLGSGSFYNWRDVKVDPNALKLIVPSHQGVYQAQQAGTTRIAATGDPKCYPRCLAPSVLFTLTVVIQ